MYVRKYHNKTIFSWAKKRIFIIVAWNEETKILFNYSVAIEYKITFHRNKDNAINLKCIKTITDLFDSFEVGKAKAINNYLCAVPDKSMINYTEGLILVL